LVGILSLVARNIMIYRPERSIVCAPRQDFVMLTLFLVLAAAAAAAARA
jgi:hypothetical protein